MLPDCIPIEIWTREIVVPMLDARDLVQLELARANLARFPGTFVATRVLEAAELAWFAARNIPVKLLEEHSTMRFSDGDNSANNFNNYQSCEFWRVNGELHNSNDRPALIRSDGMRKWFCRGKLHRDDDKPAVEMPNGDREWWQNNQRHRDGDQPAVIKLNGGHREWWQNDQLHRDGQMPAVISTTYTHWYQFGQIMF